MTVQTPPPDKGTVEPDKGTTQQPDKGTQSASDKVYKQDEVDKIMEKVRETERKKLTDKDAEIEKLRQAQMTDEEKKLKAARDEGAKDAQGKLDAKIKEDTLKDAMLEAGINPKRIRHAVALARDLSPDAEPQEAVNALKKDLPELFGKASSFGPGDGVTRSVDDTETWSSEYIDQMIAKHGTGWYAANRKKIEAQRAQNFPVGPRRL